MRRQSPFSKRKRDNTLPFKKPFLYGLRGKARWRKNRVFLSALFIAWIYVDIGKTQWSLEVARAVPLLWKGIAMVVMFASICYSAWRVNRRILDTALPPLHSAWLLWNVVAAFVFAVVSADQRVLFHVCTLLTILFLCCSEGYYRRKLVRLEKTEGVSRCVLQKK
jgi:ABC-type uncharacterized transport system permease subunit